MQPRRQERVGIHVYGSVVHDATLIEKLLKAPRFIRVEYIRTAAEELSADENLWNRAARRACGERRANLSAPVILLILHRVEIDRAVRYAVPREQSPHRPAELTPL